MRLNRNPIKILLGRIKKITSEISEVYATQYINIGIRDDIAGRECTPKEKRTFQKEVCIGKECPFYKKVQDSNEVFGDVIFFTDCTCTYDKR